MTRFSLQHVGFKDGLPIYAPLSQEDVDAVKYQKIIVCDMLKGNAKRTGLQNRALHLFCGWVSKALNDAGWDMRAALSVLSRNALIPWTASAVKERLWRPTQLAMTAKESTTNIDKGDVSIIYEGLNCALSQRLGVSVPFPDKFMKLYEEELNAKQKTEV